MATDRTQQLDLALGMTFYLTRRLLVFTTQSVTLLVLEARLGLGNVLRRDNVAQLRHALRVARLVVVPRVDLHEGSVNHLGRQGINHGAARLVRVVRRYERLGLVAEDSLQRATLAGRLERRVDFLDRHWTIDLEHTVRDTAVQQGNTNRETVELALELGVDLDNRRSGSCTGGAQVDHAAAGTAKIGLFGVGHVDDRLGSGEYCR